MFDDRSFQLQLLLFKIFSSPGNVAGTSVWPSSALGRAEESEKSCFELQWNCAPWWCQLHMLHMLEAYRILPRHLLECQGLWRMSPWKVPSKGFSVNATISKCWLCMYQPACPVNNMIYDDLDLWWSMMIYDDLWWSMMIYDDLWWSMMIYDLEQTIWSDLHHTCFHDTAEVLAKTLPFPLPFAKVPNDWSSGASRIHGLLQAESFLCQSDDCPSAMCINISVYTIYTYISDPQIFKVLFAISLEPISYTVFSQYICIT